MCSPALKALPAPPVSPVSLLSQDPTREAERPGVEECWALSPWGTKVFVISSPCPHREVLAEAYEEDHCPLPQPKRSNVNTRKVITQALA